MTSKIRIKFGAVEIEYEGPEDFLKSELPELLSAVSELHRNIGDNSVDTAIPSSAQPVSSKDGVRLQGTTNTIAAKLKCASGPELLIAALAKLIFVDEQESATYQEILEEMKSAKNYYKQAMASNYSKMFGPLIKGNKINETAKEQYTLAAKEKDRLEAILAN
jgi:hypothetical protein